MNCKVSEEGIYLTDQEAESFLKGLNDLKAMGEEARDMRAKEEALAGEGNIKAVADILAERGSRYGVFSKHAEITQYIKRIIDTHGDDLSHSQRESLDMIAHKIGRILNGDPNYADSWVDIAGYAQLIVAELEGRSI